MKTDDLLNLLDHSYNRPAWQGSDLFMPFTPAVT